MNINNHENSFLNSYNNTNVEKEKKIAKLVIFAASIGVLAGLSATYTFFFHVQTSRNLNICIYFW